MVKERSRKNAVRTKRIELAGAPAILVFRQAPEVSAAGGVVLFYHGFSAGKLANIRELRLLAQAGILGVGVDAVGHGQRRFGDFDQRFAPPRSEDAFAQVVASSVDEIPQIVDHLVALGLSDGEHLGLAGVSMGGHIAYGAVLAEPRIRAVAAIIASPRWSALPQYSPHLHPERFYPTALLTVTADKDDIVPPGPARDFHQILIPYYREQPQRLQRLDVAHAVHLMSREHWQIASAPVVPFFDRFLNEDPSRTSARRSR